MANEDDFKLGNDIFNDVRDKISQEEIDLINSSPTLKDQLHDFVAGGGKFVVKTDEAGVGYLKNVIIFGEHYFDETNHGWGPRGFVGSLAHELGHYLNEVNKATRNAINGFEYFIRTATSEAFAVGNAYVIYREVRDATRTVIKVSVGPDAQNLVTGWDTQFGAQLSTGELSTDEVRTEVLKQAWDYVLTLLPSTDPTSNYLVQGLLFYFNQATSGQASLQAPFNSKLLSYKADPASFDIYGMPSIVDMIFDNSAARAVDPSLPATFNCHLERLPNQVIQATFECDNGVKLTGIEFSNGIYRLERSSADLPPFSMSWRAGSGVGGDYSPAFAEVTNGAMQYLVGTSAYSAYTLAEIAAEQGISIDLLVAANPGLYADDCLVPGALVNLPPATNLFDLTIDPNLTDSTLATNEDGSTLYDNGICTITGIGDVNTASGNIASANNQLANGIRPGAFERAYDFLGAPLAERFLANPIEATYLVWSPEVQAAATNLLGYDVAWGIPTDPLVLDLNGDGVQLTSFGEVPVLFDIDHDGKKEITGWVRAEENGSVDGIVVMDLNHNGKIDNISETMSEYFNGAVGVDGNAGEKKYANGFAALKSLDSYSDNAFTSADDAWNNVKVWQDANHDGVTEDGELKTLGELGITSIDLMPTTRQEQLAGLDALLDTWADTGGLLETLQARAGWSYTVLWKAIGDKHAPEPVLGQDGSGVIYPQDDPEWNALVAKMEFRMHVLESFNGRYFFALPNMAQLGLSAANGLTLNTSNDGSESGSVWRPKLEVRLSTDQVNLLNQAYEALRTSVYEALLPQTRFKPVLDLINLSIGAEGISLDFSAVEAHFQDRIFQDPALGISDLIEFNRLTNEMLSGTGWQGWEMLESAIRTTPIDSSLQAVYNDLAVLVAGATGLPSYNGTTKKEIIVSGDTGDSIAGNAGDDAIFAGMDSDTVYGGDEIGFFWGLAA